MCGKHSGLGDNKLFHKIGFYANLIVSIYIDTELNERQRLLLVLLLLLLLLCIASRHTQGLAAFPVNSPADAFKRIELISLFIHEMLIT